MADLSSLIEKAFKHDQRLKGGLQQIAALDRDTFSKDEVTKLLSAVSTYILTHSPSNPPSTDVSQPLSKKRKLESDSPLSTASRWSISHSLDGTSFALPVRKKLDLCISHHDSEGLWVPTTDGSVPEIGISWSHVEHILALPVPEKAQAITQFVVIPQGDDGLSEGAEPISWTVTHARSKDPDAVDPTVSTLKSEFAARGKPVAEPSTSEFSSSMKQGLRKGETPYHVKAFRGSKEGYLYFLSTGIFYGFKKPLLFFDFGRVASISYTNVLQRTFNLNITAFTSSGGTDESEAEFEFSMLDQADFEALDAYVKRHGLNDASMAEQRRAKKLNINPVVNETEHDENEEGTELDKAGREAARLEAERLADETSDDEEDENFDPGSGGESEGEGSDSSDEEEGSRVAVQKKGRDLVEDELGSEAEEVEVSDGEED